ncbi:phage holin family protein, partial [Pseudonocardia oceani]
AMTGPVNPGPGPSGSHAGGPTGPGGGYGPDPRTAQQYPAGGYADQYAPDRYEAQRHGGPTYGDNHPGTAVPAERAAGPGPVADPAGHDPGHGDRDSRSVGELLGTVSRDLSTLVRQEIALAKAEVTQEATRTGKAAGALAGAGVAGHFVLLFLSIALWAALSGLIGSGWSGLVVALVWAIIAAVLFVTGRSNLRRVHPRPDRTVETLSTVPDALKGNRGDTR